jgi:hypothetical protein
VPEWLQLFQLVADIRTGSELPELERLKPRLVGGDAPGKRIFRTARAAPDLFQFMEHLAERVEHLGPPVKGSDNMSEDRQRRSEGGTRHAACHARRARAPYSKLNLAADEIATERAHQPGVSRRFGPWPGVPPRHPLRSIQVPEDEVISVLEEAGRVALIEEQRHGFVTYCFTHAFCRQTLYEEISVPRRLTLVLIACGTGNGALHGTGGNGNGDGTSPPVLSTTP